MAFRVEIDNESGFCYGVIRAIKEAENNLKVLNNLYSLGSIVHNGAEVERLNNLGLKVINHHQIKDLQDTTLLIRAHGEPPSTYKIAKEQNIELIDCTCPVVLKLQEKIRNTYNLNPDKKSQIVIFGKRGHAEVNGLVGQVGSDAIIVDITHTTNGIEYIGIEEIDFSIPINIFSQTTKDPLEYREICDEIKRRLALLGRGEKNLVIHNTICKQVERRHSNLIEFAKGHSVIIFVSGRESSNGKVLYDLCLSVNPRSYLIESADQTDINWLKEGDFIGVCGATSTPKWQLSEVADYLNNL